MRGLSNILSNVKRFFFFPFYILGFYNASRKLNKWMRKNEKFQDPNKHDFNKRTEYVFKFAKRQLRRLRTDVIIEGIENITKGAVWVTPNHSSTYDVFYIVYLFAKLEKQFSAVVNYDLQNKSHISGFINALEAFPIRRSNIRETIAIMNKATIWAKNNNRAMVVFPEGTRNFYGELGDFKSGTFSFPQKFYIPIVPVSIVGAVIGSKFFTWNRKKVIVRVHKPIKPNRAINLTTQKISELVRDKIKDDLDRYNNNLSESKKSMLSRRKKKLRKNQKKVERIYKEEMEAFKKGNT